MIKKIRYIIGKQTSPCSNLALEEYLLRHVEKEECILYLWQNQKTVVIGKNQNCWKECKVEELQKDGGTLVRRSSGGGAVFHDLGNLNFTFLVRKNNYDLNKQLDVILKSVQKFGIDAKRSGRNDITVDDRKFSGNAFYTSGDCCYHHGTILLDVDMKNLSKYLTVSTEKLQSKGVSSVKSRVVNLKELNSEITKELMCEKLIQAFGEVYDKTPTEIINYHDENENIEQFNIKEEKKAIQKNIDKTAYTKNVSIEMINLKEYCKESKIANSEIDITELTKLINKFSSWDWNFGTAIPFTYEVNKRFIWGDFQLQLAVNKGKVEKASVFSDALEEALISQIPKVIEGCVFSSKELISNLKSIPYEGVASKKILSDIVDILNEQNW